MCDVGSPSLWSFSTPKSWQTSKVWWLGDETGPPLLESDKQIKSVFLYILWLFVLFCFDAYIDTHKHTHICIYIYMHMQYYAVPNCVYHVPSIRRKTFPKQATDPKVNSYLKGIVEGIDFKLFVSITVHCLRTLWVSVPTPTRHVILSIWQAIGVTEHMVGRWCT